MEFLANNDVEIDYREGKANKVANALSRHSTQPRDRDIVTMMTRFTITPTIVSRVGLA